MRVFHRLAFAACTAALLALTVAGLLLAYLLFAVVPEEGKTLNAVLFGRLTADWSPGAATPDPWGPRN